MLGKVRYSERELAWRLGVRLPRLRALAATSEDRYRSWNSSAGRPLVDPLHELKHVQRLIRRRILIDFPLPDCMHGGVEGRSPLTNANVHVGKRNLAKVDLRRFFPSVTNRMVFALFRRLGFGPSPARLLTQLTTRKGHLPQGAPTSDRLAALILAPTAERLQALLAPLGLDVSVFVDDIGFSGERTREAMPIVIEQVRASGLAVGHRKTYNAGASRAHEITGYATNAKTGPKVVKRTRSRVRAAVHKLILVHGEGQLAKKRADSARGSLAHLKRTNPADVLRLERQLRASKVKL